MTDFVDKEWDLVLRDLEPLRLGWHDVQLSFSARRAASALGLAGSSELHSWLATRGLPPYQVVRNWYYLAMLTERFQRESLAHWALNRDHDPAVYYRFVLRTSGMHWKELQQKGGRWVRERALEIWRPYRRSQ